MLVLLCDVSATSSSINPVKTYLGRKLSVSSLVVVQLLLTLLQELVELLHSTLMTVVRDLEDAL